MHYWMGSLLAVAVGFVLDLLLGDPNSAYHPICLIGRLIALQKKRRGHSSRRRKRESGRQAV